MQIPVQVCFRHMEPSPALVQRVHELVDKLDPELRRIERVHVVLDTPHRHRLKGRQFDVRLDVAIPGRDLVFSRHPRMNVDETQDLYHAVTEVFEAAAVKLASLAKARVGRRHKDGVHHGEAIAANPGILPAESLGGDDYAVA